ncbi:hypothetical protein KAI52_02310 [Candidatus Parcubacteria bacterium]|nr:hypothetical protein [Candidatus Parcubacteria bacterium]
MRVKTVFLLAVMFCLVVLAGCSITDSDNTTSDSGKSKTTKVSMEGFFKEYCGIYVNKFQSRDLKSYRIEESGNMGYGYYESIDECIEEMLKIDKLAEDACEQYGKASGIDCGEAMFARQENFKKNMTQSGCVENGKSNRCFLFDTSQSRWADASADQTREANIKYSECLQKVEYACAELPKNW